jgi:pheromone a factor receptor
VVTIHRLRKHRGRLSKTLSRTGSGLDARKFLKLFLMVLVVLLLYLPILCYFFYTNWPAPFYPYSFARTHPKTWGAILYLHIAEFPAFQYWNWSPITLAFLLFFWYGITNEAINSYREGLVKIGFGKIWPILREPYVPRRSTNGSSPSRASWLNKFDMVSKAVSYMDTVKKDTTNTTKSQTSSTQTGSEM